DLQSAGAANQVGTLAANDSGAGAAILFKDTIGVAVGILPAAPCFAGASGLTTPGRTVALLTSGPAENPSAPPPAANRLLRATAGEEDAWSVITAANLRLLNGTFVLQQGNHVGTLAALTAGPISYSNATALTVGTVLGTAGISTGGGIVQIPGGNPTSSTVGV